MKKEILIPAGTKATMYQDGDKVVIEYEEKKWEPKIGEVCYWSGINSRFCLITGKYPSFSDIYKSISIGQYNDAHISMSIINLRPTTPDERGTFFANLKKAGYKWDSKKMVLKKIENAFVPKDGDFVHIPENEHLNESIIIYQNKFSFHSGMLTNAKCISIQTEKDGVAITTDRLATPSEKQLLLDAMHKSGKDWDAVNKKVVDYVWRPKMGEPYYLASPSKSALFSYEIWSNDESDVRWLNAGLIYLTKEEAIARAKRMLNTK